MSAILSEAGFRDRLANLEEQAVIAAMGPVAEEAARTQQREILAHDAALRAQVTQLAEERDAAVQLYGGALSAIRIAVKLESSQVNDIVKAVYRLQRESAARELVISRAILRWRDCDRDNSDDTMQAYTDMLDLVVIPGNLAEEAQALREQADSALVWRKLAEDAEPLGQRLLAREKRDPILKRTKGTADWLARLAAAQQTQEEASK